jgi:hypothetical protein
MINENIGILEYHGIAYLHESQRERAANESRLRVNLIAKVAPKEPSEEPRREIKRIISCEGTSFI